MSKITVKVISLPNCLVEIEEIPDPPERQRRTLSPLRTICENSTNVRENSKRKRDSDTQEPGLKKAKTMACENKTNS